MLRNRAVKQKKSFTKGVSYKSGDIGEKLFDAQNMLIVGNKLQTRYGLKRFTTDSFTSSPVSLSFYTKLDGETQKVVTKVDTAMYSASTDGVFSSIKTGLTTANKHDAVTMNGRHILAIGSDGLYSYDGTTFAALGIDAPSAPTAAIAAGGALAQPKDYLVAVTYYASGIGFETNIGAASAIATSSAGNQTIDVSAIPVSTHALVDFKRVYIKNSTDSGNYLFVSEIANGATTLSITANPSASSETPPTGKDPPLSGGAKYLAIFQNQLVAAGNSTFPHEVFFSEIDEPDAWPTDIAPVRAQGDGPITGLAVGYHNNDNLKPYLVIFKKRSFTVYFQPPFDGSAPQYIYVNGVGCPSHKTIKIKDGNVYFLSLFGWRAIANGSLVKETLAGGDIDDIFQTSGFTYGVNKSQLGNTFSVYYSEADAYLTWVAEGSSASFDKCYNYHMNLNAFMPLQITATCACSGEDDDGNEVIYIGSSDGKIYSYSIRNDYVDQLVGEGFVVDVDRLDVGVLTDDDSRAIACFAIHNWLPEDDFDRSYNFRDYVLEGISDVSDAKSTAVVKAFLNFSRTTSYEYSYDFFREEGFQLDVSMLDVGILGDDRSRYRAVTDLALSGTNVLIGIFQEVEEARLQLLSHQLNYNGNGNRN